MGSPYASTLLLPANNSVNQAISNLLFKWNKATERIETVQKYQFQVSTDENFTSIVINDSTLTDTSKTVSGLSYLTNYYWKVRASNETGWGDWSTVWKTTTIIEKPSEPTLVSPVNSVTGLLNPVTVTWNASLRAEKYILQVSYNNSFSNYMVSDSTLIDTTRVLNILDINALYYWRVKAVNVGGESQWSPTYTFRTLGDPTTCNLLYPQNNSFYINTSNLKFIWTKATEMKNIQNYHFMLAKDQLFTEIVSNDSLLVDTNKVVNNLLNNTVYYWKTRAKNQVGWGNWSIINNFRTKKKNISSPTELISSLLISSSVKLMWVDESSNETGFYIHRKLGDSLSTSELIIIDSVGLNVQTYTDTTVNLNNTYTYLVSAFNADTTSGYSNYSTIAVTMVDESEQLIPTKYSLDQNYPNPFNPSTTINFSLPKQSHVVLKIYDVLGNEVVTLINDEMQAGYYNKTWVAGQYSSGVYFYKLQTGDFFQTKKMILQK